MEQLSGRESTDIRFRIKELEFLLRDLRDDLEDPDLQDSVDAINEKIEAAEVERRSLCKKVGWDW